MNATGFSTIIILVSLWIRPLKWHVVVGDFEGKLQIDERAN